MAQLEIPLDIRDRLCQLREVQLLGPSRDEVFHREPVVILTLGLGPAVYLALDGRVIIWHYMHDEPPRETTDMREIASAVVIGARNNKLPELLDLLPNRPAAGVDCTMCSGGRWIRLPGDAGTIVESVCLNCSGLGWAR